MIKQGVKVNGMKSEILLAFIIAQDIYRQYNRDCVITSATDGKHGRGSLHYAGLAIDLRTRNLDSDEKLLISKDLKDALGKEYDVVSESDHIHIEYQPK